MTTSGTITMAIREVDRLRTIQSVIDGMLIPHEIHKRPAPDLRNLPRQRIARQPGAQQPLFFAGACNAQRAGTPYFPSKIWQWLDYNVLMQTKLQRRSFQA